MSRDSCQLCHATSHPRQLTLVGISRAQIGHMDVLADGSRPWTPFVGRDLSHSTIPNSA